MALGIDPKVDYAFKRVFGDQRNAHLLVHLLNAILDPEVPIVGVEIINPFNEKEYSEDKLTILDVKARDESGRLINVEMQMLLPRHFRSRILYYWSSLYRQQLNEGDQYDQLAPVISICLVNQVMISGADDFHMTFRLIEPRLGICFSDDIQIHVVEFPKFSQPVDKLTGDLEKWIYLLQHAEHLDPGDLPETLEDPVYDQAMQEWSMLTQNELERERYESRLKAIRDQRSLLEDAVEEGLEQGREQGLEQGREQGLEQGLEQGALIGQIQLCESLMGRTVTLESELMARSVEELQQEAAKLQGELRDRQQS